MLNHARNISESRDHVKAIFQPFSLFFLAGLAHPPPRFAFPSPAEGAFRRYPQGLAVMHPPRKFHTIQKTFDNILQKGNMNEKE